MGEFKPDHRGLAEFMRGPEIVGHLHKVVDKIKDFAEATAPVGNPDDPWYGQKGHPPPGTYAASFRTEVREAEVFKGEPRPVGFVYNDAPHAAAVEYGLGGRAKDPGHAAHYTLTRAIDAARE